MKKKMILFLAFPILFMAFLSAFLVLREGTLSKVNTVQVNSLVKQAEKNWGHINSQTFQAIEVNGDFAVIDLKGNILYSTYKIEQDTYSEIINEAMQEHDTIADIMVIGEKTDEEIVSGNANTVGNEKEERAQYEDNITTDNKVSEAADNIPASEKIVGKLIVKNDLNARLVQKEQHLLLVFIILLLCLTFFLVGYVFYLEKKLFQPFGKLEKFAAHVAAGNLDMQLTMDKDNLFGAFTESFDLMRENLKTARAKEYEANKEKQELIASLSHDIKTPIASIKAVAEIMALTSKDKHITVIQEKAEQINHLINDLFQSTMEELGELKVTPAEYDSRELLTILEGVDYGNKVKIASELPACLLVFDKLRLTQVFDNIIGNSYKYADTPIEVRFSLMDSCLTVSIKDFGAGVKEEEIPLIGGKFYRGENAAKKDGSGLGLYVSSVLLSKMKGELEFYNEPDGFVVKVSLALAGENIRVDVE